MSRGRDSFRLSTRRTGSRPPVCKRQRWDPPSSHLVGYKFPHSERSRDALFDSYVALPYQLHCHGPPSRLVRNFRRSIQMNFGGGFFHLAR
jgi:hypothetical protein